jgi:hypothetical protein
MWKKKTNNDLQITTQREPHKSTQFLVNEWHPSWLDIKDTTETASWLEM